MTVIARDGRCTHTPCRTHTFFALFPCMTYRHEHAWLKAFATCVSYLPISLSPFSCFIRRLCCSRAVTSTPRSLLHRLRRALPEAHLRTSAGKFGYLADPTHLTIWGMLESCRKPLSTWIFPHVELQWMCAQINCASKFGSLTIKRHLEKQPLPMTRASNVPITDNDLNNLGAWALGSGTWFAMASYSASRSTLSMADEWNPTQ